MSALTPKDNRPALLPNGRSWPAGRFDICCCQLVLPLHVNPTEPSFRYFVKYSSLVNCNCLSSNIASGGYPIHFEPSTSNTWTALYLPKYIVSVCICGCPSNATIIRCGSLKSSQGTKSRHISHFHHAVMWRNSVARTENRSPSMPATDCGARAYFGRLTLSTLDFII